ncbi:gliding motility-associated C-terminal domain-containing protein [Flavobacterium sp. UBA6135]|uniref:T9SS type B sorting domain-containing protein n=1 Tax=Flavobacterium sp. UBA6135 TaxID=1946553 RepID=UPI0025B918E4|nr:gliding motility-associated C-terminal domain-containing protein [Flavobacterium sp. UBA6135]
MSSLFGQDVTLYQQFNGRFDFTFIGNTLNPMENTYQSQPDILSSSEASLNLTANDSIVKAYLYWAGSGTGDFDIKLNNISFQAERTFSHQRISSGLTLDYFSAFVDVTDYLSETGNGSYLFSDLDVSAFLAQHFMVKTNFAGWAIIIIYKNDDLPLNQINVYDGLQGVPQQIQITLSSLNVIDDIGAKIGFLAWEGDVGIAVNETLTINGSVLSNPPLNPANNAFNGTNSFTGSTNLYNMDLDVYDIQNNIQPGDSSAQIALTSGQDFVMINAVVTKLNSQVPDAVIEIDSYTLNCDSRFIIVDYTVYNLATATNPLPTATPIAIYANNILIGTTATTTVIEIGASESGTIVIQIPIEIEGEFTLTFVVDDIGNGTGIVSEIDETNNSDAIIIELIFSPETISIPDLYSCNEGLGRGTFDLTAHVEDFITNSPVAIAFYESENDAFLLQNQILNPTNYSIQPTPKTIYIRIENEDCFSIISFDLKTRNCPPTIFNFVSANNDGFNDNFFIDGLKDIFLNYELFVYNRWGVLLWIGRNNDPFWQGEVTERKSFQGSNAPEGTYYYVLELNDPDYLAPFVGYLYLTR